MIWLDEGGRQRNLRLIPPPAALDGAIEHFWIQGAVPGPVWRVVPDLSAHVLFSVTNGPNGASASCRVVGARSRFFDAHTAGRTLTIGARLRPGALPHLLRDNASQLSDRSVALDCITGSAGRSLAERMAEAPQQEALKLLTEFLMERLAAAPPTFPRNLIPASTSVTEMAQVLHLSRRGVYGRLLDSVGLPPKLALRIQRLHTALYALNTRTSLADAAAHAGYADQAHFTREASCLLGQPPAIWRLRGCSFLQDGNTPEGDNGGQYADPLSGRHCGMRRGSRS